MKHPEDHEILDWFTQNASKRERAFTAITVKYGERLYLHIHRYLKNHEDTNDVLQNVFIKVFRNLNSFNGDSSLYTWMYRIATNESLNFIQSNKRHDHTSVDGTFIQISSDHNDLPEAELIETFLKEAIQTLPEKQAMVFELRYFDEVPFAEISKLTGTSEGGLKASYHIARQKVEDFLKHKLNLSV
ncbi:MAG: sigma-70 family RNA polymerase sigma factor [Bacteroidetes bacterium]|nr:MAG: sigma-70 family RNA polymerase sigma factor [Bacteroidota bacterium]TNE96108.1 MAG: sigma-70 family RNA polymerase sigma factor [Bacteroidota bacterium]